MRYLPFITGNYTTAPGLTPLIRGPRQEDRQIFQVDSQYEHYITNKIECRREDIKKYYLEHEMNPETAVAVNRTIVRLLVAEHPEQFSYNKVQDIYAFTNTRL